MPFPATGDVAQTFEKKAQAFPSKDKRKGAKKPSETRFKSPTASGSGVGDTTGPSPAAAAPTDPEKIGGWGQGRATASEPRPHSARRFGVSYGTSYLFGVFFLIGDVQFELRRKEKPLRKHETHPSSSASRRAVVLAESKNGSADAGGEDAEARFIEEQERKP